MGKGGSWSDMTCSERVAVIFMCITCVAVLFTLAVNIYVMVIAGRNTWFTRCSDCAGAGGDQRCVECCMDCTLMDKVMFYINRIYAIFMCLWSLVAELQHKKFLEWCFICRYYFPRGFLLMFLGFWTIVAGIADPRNGFNFTEIIGYLLVAVSILNFALELCCLTERGLDNAEKDDDEEMQGAGPPPAAEGAPPRPGTAQPTSAPPQSRI